VLPSVMLTVEILGAEATPPGPGPDPTPSPGAVGPTPLDGRVPHLAYPLRRAASGALAVVEQDTLADVRQCVHLLARTPRGARPLAPDIGVEDPTFGGGVDPLALAGDLESWEPRAAVRVEADGPGGDGAQRVRVHVDLAAEGLGAEEA